MNDQAEQAVDPQVALLAALDDTPQEEIEQAEDEAPEVVEPEAVDDEDDDESPKVDQKFRVKVKNDAGQDEDRDLTLEELAAGYMLQADATRKTQALAQERKQVQEQYFSAVQQNSQQAQGELRALQQFVVANAAPELQNVNWQQLAAEDPARYVQLQARQQQLGNVLAQIQAQGDSLKQQEAAQLSQQREQTIQDSLSYLSREIPGFNLEKERNGLFDTGRKYGFQDGELSNIVDGRMLHVLRDAQQWRDLQTAKPKAMQKVVEAPKVIRPAAPQPKKSNQAALQRLQQSGRASDLVAFL